MSTDIPRPERVTLSAEEHDRIRFAQHDGLCPEGSDCRSRFPHSHSTTVTATLSPSLIAEFERILAVREQALREEIAQQIEACTRTLGATDPGDPVRAGLIEGYRDAARIARGGAR